MRDLEPGTTRCPNCANPTDIPDRPCRECFRQNLAGKERPPGHTDPPPAPSAPARSGPPEDSEPLASHRSSRGFALLILLLGLGALLLGGGSNPVSDLFGLPRSACPTAAGPANRGAAAVQQPAPPGTPRPPSTHGWWEGGGPEIHTQLTVEEGARAGWVGLDDARRRKQQQELASRFTCSLIFRLSKERR